MGASPSLQDTRGLSGVLRDRDAFKQPSDGVHYPLRLQNYVIEKLDPRHRPRGCSS
jgi:hypothetical protein